MLAAFLWSFAPYIRERSIFERVLYLSAYGMYVKKENMRLRMTKHALLHEFSEPRFFCCLHCSPSEYLRGAKSPLRLLWRPQWKGQRRDLGPKSNYQLKRWGYKQGHHQAQRPCVPTTTARQHFSIQCFQKWIRWKIRLLCAVALCARYTLSQT